MAGDDQRRRVVRFIAVLALVAAAGVTFIVLARGNNYTLDLHFENAGQLVHGGEVRIAGRKVGSISRVALASNGEADVRVSISDDRFTPLHEGTRASIRAVGQAGLANRYVSLTPGPVTLPELDTGSVLPSSQTSGFVDLDAILNTFGERQRHDLQGLFTHSAEVFDGSGSAYLNSMLGKLGPALHEFQGLTSDLASDQADLSRLLSTSSATVRAVNSRGVQLGQAVDDSARWLTAVARERAALAETLTRAPATLAKASTTLDDAQRAVTTLRPALRDVRAAAPSLQTFLSRIPPSLSAVTPVLAQLRAQLPGLRSSLSGLEPLRGPGVRALATTGRAVGDLQHILPGLRAYGPDFLLGVINGLAGISVGNYNPYGHYLRLEFTQTLQVALSGALGPALTKNPIVPGILDLKVRQLRRCPGAAAPPAPDGSNPYVPFKNACDPSQGLQAAVNTP